MVTQASLDRADDLRQRSSDEANRIRGVGRYTDAAKRAMIARTYLDAHEKMGRLATESATSDAETRTRAQRRAFGAADLASDPATLAVSVRDASDRAATITNPRDAHELLERASLNGDEVLARAVAAHAHRQSVDGLSARDGGWQDVLETFAASRPAAAEALDTLRARAGTPSIRELFAHALPKPAELSSLDLGAISRLADTLP